MIHLYLSFFLQFFADEVLSPAPALEAVKYKDITLQNKFDEPSIYRGPPTLEREQAWLDLWGRKSLGTLDFNPTPIVTIQFPLQTQPSASQNLNSIFSTNPSRRKLFGISPHLSAAASPAFLTSFTNCTASTLSVNTPGSLLVTTDRHLPPSQENSNNTLYFPFRQSSTALAMWLTACMPTIVSKLCAKPSCVMPM